MKTTIEIADDLFEQVRQLARQEKTTFRALTEHGLRLALKERRAKKRQWKWKPVTCGGSGLTPEFQHAKWQQIRDEVYHESPAS